MAAVKIMGFTFIKSQTERDIQKHFENYATKLNEQKSKMIDDITEWTDAVMQSIYKHANRQKYHVEQDYVTQIQNLNKTSHEFIEELRVYEERKDIKRINQLLEQCATLKFELTALETNGQSIPFIELPGKRKSSVISEDEFNVTGIERSEFDNGSLERLDNVHENGMNTHSSSSSFRSFGNTTQSGSQSLQINFVNDGHPQSNNAKDDGSIKKCPVCFMIFPTTMTPSNRTRHIEEHYTDD